MKAVVINEYGGKDVLEEAEVATPAPGPKQVLVKAEATSINPIDWKLREGYLKEMFEWEFPIILGWDVAGVIEAVGEGVSNWQVGDRVFARPNTSRQGTYAEYTLVDQDLLSFIPENLTAKEAAAVPLAGLTAWQALFTFGQLQKGERVLIHGGAGGVGIFAIQLAKHAGAYVYTTASKINHDLVRSLGADEVIDYQNENFVEKLANIDLVFDTVGGDVQSSSYHVIKKSTGRLVTIAGVPDQEEADSFNVKATGVWLEPDGEQLQRLAALIEENQIRVVIDRSFPFSLQGIESAHKQSETGHASGKIVITFD